MSKIDPVLLGKELASVFYEHTGHLAKRISDLEATMSGVQKRLDALSDSAMKFAGEHQLALSYERGAVTKHEGSLYVALKHIDPGKAEPARNGSGWAKLTDRGTAHGKI